MEHDCPNCCQPCDCGMESHECNWCSYCDDEETYWELDDDDN